MSKFTVVITASYIPSHPSTKIIDRTLDSLKFISIDQNFPIILAHDFSCNKAYLKYLDLIKDYNKKYSKINIYVRSNHGHLVGNIRNIIDFIDTKYVLMIQHDFPFIREFEINKIIEDIDQQIDIKYVRFNKRRTIKTKWDAISKIFGKQVVCKNYTYTRTPCWSDNNHLCTTEYYKNIVLTECKDGTAMEHTLGKKPKTEQGHKKYGTYIFGAYGEEGVIKHINGRRTK